MNFLNFFEFMINDFILFIKLSQHSDFLSLVGGGHSLLELVVNLRWYSTLYISQLKNGVKEVHPPLPKIRCVQLLSLSKVAHFFDCFLISIDV